MRHNNKQRRKKSEFSSKHIKLLTELLTFFKLNQSAIECDSFWMTIFLSIVNIQLTSLLFRLKRTKIVRMVLHLNYFKIQSSIFFFFVQTIVRRPIQKSNTCVHCCLRQCERLGAFLKRACNFILSTWIILSLWIMMILIQVQVYNNNNKYFQNSNRFFVIFSQV